MHKLKPYDMIKQTDKLEFVEKKDMEIKEIKENKKQFLSLLLLADEQEDMIDRFLIEEGCMYLMMMVLNASVS